MTPRDKIDPTLEAARALEPKRGTRKACTFRQRDLAAALRAAKQAGQPVREVLIDPADGKLRIVFGAPEPVEPVAEKAAAPKQVWLDLARKR